MVAFAACRRGFDPIEQGADAPEDTTSEVDDAAPGVCTDAPCNASGGTCVGATCVIARTSESAVTCPSGMPCRIECTGAGRPCRDGASCGGATVCELRCIGYRACQVGASCGTAQSCTVTCDGEAACEDGVRPESTGSCTGHCCGLSACALGVGSCSLDAVCN